VVQRGRFRRNIANGRALVEKTLQREGKTSVNLDQLASKLGFKTPEDLYAVVAKEEFSLRNVEVHPNVCLKPRGPPT
jgi:(p)ppGpp synthase/HD superfamily hydrolase